MRSRILNRLTAAILAGIMTVSAIAGTALTAEASTEGGSGKYVSDVFIAYGEDEEDAAKWLRDNGWEPVSGDFNAGKASEYDDDVAAVMGIKRTNIAENAITDMAVMNMTGGYSLPDYESLVEEKKSEIDEYIRVFMPVIREFRTNYNGGGSEFGKKRADEAYRLLNLFYDGSQEDVYAVNDTGMHLGDLFLQELRQEGNESGGDLRQIILESSGPAMLTVESTLAFATDPGEETWLERLSGLSGDGLAENIGEYVPNVAGQNLADSAITALLNQKFGDAADALASQWSDIHEAMVSYEDYNDAHDLWQHEDETDEEYQERYEQYIESIGEDDTEFSQYYGNKVLYDGLYALDYTGEWGETLGDFFYPHDGSDYSTESDKFLPLAAALSEGQRAALELISLQQLICIGLGSEEGMSNFQEAVDDILEDNTEVSIYTGVNRGIFRGGVAITSRALMEQNMGRGDAYEKLWNNSGIVVMIWVFTLVTGMMVMFAGYGVYASGASENPLAAIPAYQTAGRWIMGVGGVLLFGAAILKVIQLYKYYHRDFTPIPRMIVDKSDIVTYVKDENGNNVLDENGMPKKNIDFKQYEYYDAVRCNRQQIGKISDWQDGVDEYDEHGCGDIADLNVDQGREWLALYTVKSKNKGNPILADSLTLQYGAQNKPAASKIGLHFFTYEYPMDLADKAYAFEAEKGAIYFSWNSDANAYAAASGTASTFSVGYMALAAVAGLLVGILGTTLVTRPKKKRAVVSA